MPTLAGIAPVRLFASVAAVLLATWICIQQNHVHILLSQPATYSSPLHHRCGLLLLACVVWFFAESLHRARRSA